MIRYLLLCLLLVSVTACSTEPKSSSESMFSSSEAPSESVEMSPPEPESSSQDEDLLALLNPEGMTVESRIQPPAGFVRADATPSSFAHYTRSLPLKPDQSPVLLYDGSEKGDQSAHIAVLSLDVGDRDLQQCADAVMRITAEYLFANDRYDEIGFHLTNGFYFPYSQWRSGKRLVVEGNTTTLVQKAEEDSSYETFRKYLNMVFAYAGTLSLAEESTPVTDISYIKTGDFFIKGGSPGHAVIVLDTAVNEDTGEIAFLLAQSYMPAQDIHILRNPLHIDDPWYYTHELTFPLKTPQYIFDNGSLKTLGY